MFFMNVKFTAKQQAIRLILLSNISERLLAQMNGPAATRQKRTKDSHALAEFCGDTNEIRLTKTLNNKIISLKQ